MAEAPKTYEVEGTIIKKSGIGGGGHRRNFYLVLGPKDGSEPVIIMIYNASLDSTFVKDRTVRLTGLVKRDQTLLYVSSSRSSFKSPYAPSKEQLEAASSMMFPADGPSTKTSVKRSISQALADETTRSTVVGKVVKVSPTKRVRGDLAVKSLAVEDESGHAKMVLFKEMAEKEFKEGDIISCTNVYRKIYMNRAQLTTVSTSQLEFVQSDALELMDSQAAGAFDDDPDFSKPESAPQHTIDEIMYTDVYTPCCRSACKNTKYREGACPNCGDSNSQVKTARAVMKTTTGEQVTAFEGELKKLVKSDILNLESNDSLLSQVIAALPLRFTCQIRNGTLRNCKTK